jgi:signal transduction histidine kinase
VAQLKEFSLALGVINNILICDDENRILFVGDEIRGQLFKPGTDVKINDSLLDHFSDPAVQEELKEKIDAARDCKCTRYFKFRNGVKDLFIFPANYAQRGSIILATEEQIRRANSIETELKERVKELQALYNISNELELAKDLDNALDKCVGHLAAGFQYRECLTANIKLDGRLYGDMECIPGTNSNRLAENILTNGEIRGEVAVCYQKKAEFLGEEKDLLREVALMLSRIIERKESRKNLEDQRELLVSKNEELTQLTHDLTRTNNNFKAFLAAITDTIVVIDSNYNITQSNKESVGIGGKCYKKIFNSDEMCENCPAADAFQKGQPAAIEKKHENQYFTLQAYPIQNGDSTVETVLEICSDITEEEQIKTQLIQSYKLASLGKLVAGVAHEINNPNTFIRGNIKIVNEAFGDIIPILDRVYEEDKELKIARLKYEIFKEHIPILLDDMMGGANRIKKIVDGLRNFAKKDEGLLTDDVDINNLIQNNLRITEKEVRKHAKLKLNLDTSIPVFKGNFQKLEQVLMNMLINASQAIEREDGLILIETGENSNGNEIYIKISDNGKGMEEDTRKHIFDPFYTTKRDKGGTGLGLSISYGIIQEHNGRIEVDSQVGAGTTFTITLPIVTSVN